MQIAWNRVTLIVKHTWTITSGVIGLLVWLGITLFLIFIALGLLRGLVDLAAQLFDTTTGRFILAGCVAGIVGAFVILRLSNPRRVKYRATNKPFILLLGSFARTLEDAKENPTVS